MPRHKTSSHLDQRLLTRRDPAWLVSLSDEDLGRNLQGQPEADQSSRRTDDQLVSLMTRNSMADSLQTTVMP